MGSNFISNFTIEFVLVIDSVIELKMWFFFIRGPPVVGLCFHVRGRNDWKITFFTQFLVVQMLLNWMWKSNAKNFFCHKHKFYTFQLVYLQPDNVNSFWHLALELGKAEKHSLDLLLNRTNDNWQNGRLPMWNDLDFDIFHQCEWRQPLNSSVLTYERLTSCKVNGLHVYKQQHR